MTGTTFAQFPEPDSKEIGKNGQTDTKIEKVGLSGKACLWWKKTQHVYYIGVNIKRIYCKKVSSKQAKSRS